MNIAGAPPINLGLAVRGSDFSNQFLKRIFPRPPHRRDRRMPAFQGQLDGRACFQIGLFGQRLRNAESQTVAPTLSRDFHIKLPVLRPLRQRFLPLHAHQYGMDKHDNADESSDLAQEQNQ